MLRMASYCLPAFGVVMFDMNLFLSVFLLSVQILDTRLCMTACGNTYASVRVFRVRSRRSLCNRIWN